MPDTIISWVAGPNEFTGVPSAPATGWQLAALRAFQISVFGHVLPGVPTLPAYPQIITPELCCCGPCKCQWVLVNALEDDTFPSNYFGPNLNPDWKIPSDHSAGVFVNWMFGQYFCPGLQLGSSYGKCATLCPRKIGDTKVYFGLAIPQPGFIWLWQNIDVADAPFLPPALSFYYNNEVIWTISGASTIVQAAAPGSAYFGADSQPHQPYSGISAIMPTGAIPLTSAWSFLPYTGPLILDLNGDVDPVFEIHAFAPLTSTIVAGPAYFGGAPDDRGNSIFAGWDFLLQTGGFNTEGVYPIGPMGIGSAAIPFSNPWNATDGGGNAIALPGIFFSLNIHPPTD